MAYFPNGIMGECFEKECSKCKFGEKQCPIACVQQEYNYEAVDNDVATKILEDLVKDNGRCTMLRTFWDELHV